MTLPRIYQAASLQPGDSIQLDQRARHHLVNVLRLHNAAAIIVFNGLGGEYQAVLQLEKKTAYATQLVYRNISTESSLQLQLIQGIARNDRMDLILQKAVELGVTRITPIWTEFSAVKQQAVAKRWQHWYDIIISACEQCGRCELPTLDQPNTFARWLATDPSGAGRIMLEPSAESALTADATANPCRLLIGPEGGFSSTEIAQAAAAGYQLYRLGARVLRVETAAIAGISILQYLAGDFT